MMNQPQIPDAAVEFVAGYLSSQSPCDRCTAKVVSAILERFPDINVPAVQLSRTVARHAWEMGFVLYVNDEPAS